MATQAPDNNTSNLLGGRWVIYVQGIRERSKKYVTAWRISFFVLGVVFSDSFAEYVLVQGLIDFLTSIQGKGLPYAAATINIKEGLASLLAILGALLSDTRLGRYRLILLSVFCYILGLGFFTLTASEKLSTRRANTAVFYIALLFIAAGQGGQQHTLRAFGLDQFESHIRDGVKARIHTRAWWYLGTLVGVIAGITVNSFLSQEAIDREQPKLNWEFGGISSLAAMVVTLILFVSGTFLFSRVRPQGSPLARVLRVFLAALRNRHLPYPESESELFENGHVPCDAPDQSCHGNYVNEPCDGSRILIEDPQLLREKLNEDAPRLKERGEESALSAQRGNDQSEEIVPAGGASLSGWIDPPVNDPDHDPVAANLKDPLFLSLPHTEGLRCLDKAAIRDPSQDVEAQLSKWKLCTVTQVEETKVLLRMFPIWATFLMYGVVSSMGNTFFLEQGGNLNRDLRPDMEVPLTALLAFSGFSNVVTTQFLLPLLNRVLKLEKGIPPEIRIWIGLLISILCCITAATVETHRLNVVHENGLIDKPDDTVPMSVFFLVPQFVLLGVMEGFAGDGLSDFFDDHVPLQMRVYKQLSSESVKGTGSLVSALLIFITTVASKFGGKSSWFQDTINASRLNLFYWLIAILSGVNLLLYVFIAVKHSPYKLPALGGHHQEEEEEEEVQVNPEEVTLAIEEIL